MNKRVQFMGLNLTRRVAKKLFLFALATSILSAGFIAFVSRFSDENIGMTQVRDPQTVVYSMADGKYVEVVSAGVKQVYKTKANTLFDFFKEQDLRVPDRRELGAFRINDSIKNGMKLKITRIEDKFIRREVTLYKSTVRKPSTAMLIGQSRVVQLGRNGKRVEKYKVTYVNGKKIRTKLIASNVVAKPLNTIISYGTQNVVRLSRGGSIRIKKVYTMEATAYSTDGGSQSTATGRRAVKGVVAVDPSVIPLGSRLYIESLDGTTDYGYAIAADTGGAINGKKIDLCYNTSRECYIFGRRNVRVYVLE